MLNGFVITKKDDPISESMAEECISSAHTNGLYVEKFYGIYPDSIDKEMESEKLKLNEAALKKIRPGVIGCFLSHYKLWNKCYESNSPIVIFEYDALVINKISYNLLEKFEDYLNLDFTRHLYLNQSIDTYLKNLQQSDSIEVNTFEPELPRQVKSFGYKFMNRAHIKGAYGYILKPSGAKKLIECTKEDGIVPADVAINLKYLNMSYTTPSIVQLNPRMLSNLSGLSHTKE